jgi:uncharacterized RDD family membrane protein YckC
VKQSFTTSVGRVDVAVYEDSRVVSLQRFEAGDRPVAAAMESWDGTNLGDVLTRQIGVPQTEAEDIASVVRENAGPLRFAAPPVEQLPLERDHFELTENAGVALRFVAVLLDSLIVFFPAGIVIGLLSGGGYAERGDGYANAGVDLGGNAFWLLLVLGIAYYVFCEALAGATLGKRIVGIRVVGEDGRPLTLEAAIIRNLLRPVDGLFLYLVGAVFALTSPRGQRLGDRAAHTLVVRR